MAERVARRRHGRNRSILKPTRLVAPAHTRVDVRLAWRPTDRLEFSLVGRNLLEPQHLEFDPPALRAPVDVPCSVVLKATYGL